MSNYPIGLRTLLRLTILLSCWLQSVSAATNVTVADTDPSIAYLPSSSWHASTSLCASCLNPGEAISFHEGIHEPITTKDPDDHSSSSSTKVASTSTSDTPVASIPAPPTSSQAPPVSQTVRVASTPSAAPAPEESGDGKKQGKQGTRRSLMRRVLQTRVDVDDVDPDVRIAFNFTGSAVYVYGILPPLMLNANGTSPNMNLTFFLDNVSLGQNTMQASESTFTPNEAVFWKTDMTEGPHQLVIRVGQNSTFIFQHLIYTSGAINTSSTTSVPSSTSAAAQTAPSSTVNPKVKAHNIATFGGAVGGSVGVLALFSLGLAISIIRRRQLAARRDRLDRESLHTNASDDSPMSGPAPFVPRYFPDTVIPPDPPTYMAALATNHNNSTLLATLSASAFGATQRSYADIPPTTPPPPLEDAVILPPPPPFPIATTAPPLDPLPEEEEGALPPSIPGAEPSDSHHSAISVRTESSTSAPELVSLLQAAEPDSTTPTPRPRTAPSPISSSGEDDLPEGTEPEAAESTPLRANVS